MTRMDRRVTLFRITLDEYRHVLSLAGPGRPLRTEVRLSWTGIDQHRSAWAVEAVEDVRALHGGPWQGEPIPITDAEAAALMRHMPLPALQTLRMAALDVGGLLDVGRSPRAVPFLLALRGLAFEHGAGI